MKKVLFLTLAILSLFLVPIGLLSLAIYLPSFQETGIQQRTDVTEDWVLERVQKYAPVILQEINQEQDLAKYDFICGLNFDGDWNSANNSENIENKKDIDAKGTVYYSFFESDTHFFITYSIFHPVEWNYNVQEAKKELWYENNIETLQVVVRKKEKDGVEGEVVLTAIQRAANVDFFITNKNDFKEARIKFKQEPLVLVDDNGNISETGTHPLLVVKSGRHSLEIIENCKDVFIDPGQMKMKNGLHYYPATSGTAPVFEKNPEDNSEVLKNNQKIQYGLVDMIETLWQEETQKEYFEQPFIKYKDQNELMIVDEVPLNTKGHLYTQQTKQSHSPFGLGKGMGKHSEGYLFFNPLLSYRKFFLPPKNFSKNYTYFPFSQPKE